MTFAHLAKDTAAQSAGTQLVAVAVPYAAGDIVVAGIRRRAAVTSCYLTNSADVPANRFNLTLRYSTTKAATTHDPNLSDVYFATVPGGITYDRVIVNLAVGATSNTLSTMSFSTAGLQTPSTLGDIESAQVTPPSNYTTVPLTMTGQPTGGSQLCLALVSLSATANVVNAATNGFTNQSVIAAGSRSWMAWKIVPGGTIASTTMSWTNSTVANGFLVTLQEAQAATPYPIALDMQGLAFTSFTFGTELTTAHVNIAVDFQALDSVDFTFKTIFTPPPYIPKVTIIRS